MPGVDTISAASEQLATVCRRLAAAGLVRGTSGNASARVGDHLVVTPTGGVLADLGGADAAILTLDGEQVGGDLAPTSEVELHLAVYADHPDAGAVIHTHAPVATALSCVLDELPCVHYEMLAFGGAVRVAPYTTFGTPELAASVRAALEGKRAALLSNHGTVTYGTDLDDALRMTELLEWAATVYWRAASLGTPRALGEVELQAVVEAVASRGYGATRASGSEEERS